MEHWKRNDPSLRIGDSEDDTIIMSDNEEEVEVPPLAERIGPVITGQRAVRSSPGYREAREQRRQEKSKVQELEPVKGTCATRKRVSAALAESFVEAKWQYEQALPFLLGLQECLAARVGSPEEDSEKENRDVGEGPSHGFLHLIPDGSPSPIPIPPPRKKPSLEKVTESLHRSFKDGRQQFLSGGGVPWLEHALERHSPEPQVERSGVGYVSVSDVDEFLNMVVGKL